jgi:membrane-associated phospholipid phosphatase
MKFRLAHLCSLLLLAPTARLQADVITAWNDLMLDTFASQGSTATPPLNSRTMGMLGGAMFDAVNSINRNYESYLGYFEPTTAGVGIDINAAASVAAYTVLNSIYVSQYGAGNAYLASFNSMYNSQMSGIADGEAKTRGIEVGLAAAQAMVTARANDGSNAPVTYSPQPFGTPGRWQPGTTVGAWGTSSGSFLNSQWGGVSPFTLNSSSQFRPDGPAGFNGNHTSWVQSTEYAAEFNQVKSLGGLNSTTRTADQTQVAYFWVDGPGTSSPPGHWNRIAQSVAASAGLSVEENARLFAHLNLAMADVGIATWEAKVHYDTWRPMIAINTADSNLNPDTIADASWAPLIPTPSFGAYTSGHSAFSMAGATVLASYFGNDTDIVVESESPFLQSGLTRSFSSFTDAAEEAGMSRIYGGIHWASDNVDGAILGENVGNFVYSNFLQAVPEPCSLLLIGIAGLTTLRRRRST